MRLRSALQAPVGPTLPDENRLIALTGSTGFVGRYLTCELPKLGYRVRVLLRRPSDLPFDGAGAVIGDLTKPQNLTEALSGAYAVIHTAGLSAAMTGRPEDDFRLINTAATLTLARAAERAKVKRFVFLSSIRAQSGPASEKVLTETDEPNPTDAYGRSKLAAEQGLAGIDVDWVALRLVLTYGPGVQGNIWRLVQLSRSRLPLPLTGLEARRSLLSLDNLIPAVHCLLSSQDVLRRPYIVADAEALTVASMVTIMRAALGRDPGLFHAPQKLVQTAFWLARSLDLYERIGNSLVVDCSALRQLGWTPVITTVQGLQHLVQSAAAK